MSSAQASNSGMGGLGGLNFGAPKPSGGNLSKLNEDPFAELIDERQPTAPPLGGMNLGAFA
jgi:hypothetical protein